MAWGYAHSSRSSEALLSARPRQLSNLVRSLPEGTLSVGLGLVVSGVATYAYLALTARAVGPERYAAISTLWASTVLVALGCFLPLEQEIARAVSGRRALGAGSGPMIRRAARAGGAIVALLAILAIVATPLLDRLFDGNAVLVASLILSFPTYAAVHVTRGLLAGHGRFRGYGELMAGEAVIRLVACVGLVVTGVTVGGPFGLALALAPGIAVAGTLLRERGLVTDGPPAPWAELTASLGYLVTGAVLAQVLVNGPVVAVKLLAGDAESSAAGRFLAGVIVARIPLFLFAAVQAALLPRLSALAAAGRTAEFRASLGRLLALVAAVAVFATVVAGAVGPPVVRLVFGAAFSLDNRDLALLAAGSGAYMLALVFGQALIAAHAHRRVMIGWAVGVLAFATALVPSADLLVRVESAYVVGTLVATVALGVLLIPSLRDVGPPGLEPEEQPLVVDPFEP